MDKFEYKVKSDEIKELIAQKEYEQAAEIADTIDWRRVKSVMMLCTISDLYKMCRRYEDSRDMLLLAYERHPGGRTIVYALCELSIKMEEFMQAVEYYKEFVQIAPKDSGRYILQYKLYEAQDVSLEERIAVLEELKKKDYREKWAYELAYLYHRVGLATKCVEECDELELWFGDGKYVSKALELKMLHVPLTAEQQYKYDHRFGESSEELQDETNVEEASVSEESGQNAVSAQTSAEEIDIQVKTLDVGKYDTINLQEELAAGIQEYFGTAKDEAITRSIMEPMMNSETTDITLEAMKAAEAQRLENEEAAENESQSEVFFGETDEISQVELAELPVTDESIPEETAAKAEKAASNEQPAPVNVQPPKEMENVLSMEADGQISFVLPEREPIEKQITGQISINDFMLEWERIKKENEEKRKAEIRQRVLQQTGPMFTDFEIAMKAGLLEQLESGADDKEETLADIFGDNISDAGDEDLGEVEELTEIAEDVENIDIELVEENSGQTDMELMDSDIGEDDIELVIEEIEQIDIEENEIILEGIGEVAELTEVSGEEPFEEEFVEEVITDDIIEEIALAVDEEELGKSEAFADTAAAETPVEEVPAAETPSEEVTAAETSDEAVTVAEEVSEPEEKIVREKHKVRSLTKEEKELYGQYIQGRSSKEQLIKAIDGISMAAYTGNVIVTGDEGMDPLGLAKNIIREIQMTDSNFSGKIAKISGDSLNGRDVKQIVNSLNNGAMIVQKASLMSQETADNLYKALQQEHSGIIVVLEDTKRMIDRFLDRNEKLLHCFTSRVDVAALSNDALVAFARKYAREKEYSIDEMGMLALHTRIAEMQTSDHAVTILEVKEIMDEAMESANRKTIGHFFDVLFARRYDDEDMIILKEKDFI